MTYEDIRAEMSRNACFFHTTLNKEKSFGIINDTLVFVTDHNITKTELKELFKHNKELADYPTKFYVFSDSVKKTKEENAFYYKPKDIDEESLKEIIKKILKG